MEATLVPGGSANPAEKNAPDGEKPSGAHCLCRGYFR
jgi:hypothetical protein